MKLAMRTILILSLFALLAGCGGGQTTTTGGNPAGNGGDNTGGTTTSFTLKIGLQGTSQLVTGINATVVLPAGVSVATAGNGILQDGVLTATGLAAGNGNLNEVSYNPTTRTLHFILVTSTAGGIAAGEFATLAATVSGATLPAPSAFSGTLTASAADYSTLAGVTPSFQVVP